MRHPLLLLLPLAALALARCASATNSPQQAAPSPRAVGGVRARRADGLRVGLDPRRGGQGLADARDVHRADPRPRRGRPWPRDRELRAPRRRRLPLGPARSALDLLDRRRHGLATPTCAGSCSRGHAAAAGRRADRGAGQLLRLRLPAARRGDEPFAVTRRGRPRCPWNAEHRLVRIGLQGPRDRPRRARRRATWSSCSTCPARWTSPTSCRWSSRRMKLLVEQLGENDRVAIVVYAGAAGLVLAARRRGRQARAILAAHRPARRPAARPTAARASSSPTRWPREHFIPGGINRVILATDGDFNVGITSDGELVAPDRGEGARAASS